MPLLISDSTVDCWRVDPAMSEKIDAIDSIRLRISSIEVPVARTRSLPVSTSARLSPIRRLISFAESDARAASRRTSEATTAKPRPASPARAASTPAFSASRLVWKAMSSITSMMRVIWTEESSIRPIAETASRTTASLRRASSRLCAIMRSADSAVEAISRTPSVNWSSAAEDCSIVAA